MRIPSIRPRGARALAVLLAVAVLLPPPQAIHAADPQPYKVEIKPTGNAALDQAVSGSSTLISLRESAPVGAFALIARARNDADRFQTALNSFGYYEGQVNVRIDGRPLDDPALPDLLDRAPAEPAVPVTVTLEKGPLFHLRRVSIEGNVPQSARDQLDLKPGAPAAAANVLAARKRLLDALREQGYALAKVDDPVAILRSGADALDVTYKVTTGPRVDIGPIAFKGLDQVNASFVRKRLELRQGEQFSPSAIETARQDLVGLGVFSAVRAEPADSLDAAGELPITFTFTERKRHAVTFGVGYATDLGANATATWSDRNLFGNAEQLNLTAGFQAGGTAQRAPGYNVNLQFIKPDFLARDQQLQADIGAIKQSLQAYDQTAVLGDVLLNRKFSEHWSGSIGLAAEQERIKQEGVTRDYTLLGIPIVARYDSTDSLFQPTRGVRASASVTPTESFGKQSATFVLLQVTGSTYLDMARIGLTKPGRSIIAVRGTAGDAEGASQFELPPDKRFYAGGSGTVRGYRYQSVGPKFPFSNNPQGGVSLLAASVEYRQRILENYGAAVFVDAGQVSADGGPGTGTWRLGAGVGARYYTSLGPIRADIALPLSKIKGSDSVEFYLGIGEAF